MYKDVYYHIHLFKTILIIVLTQESPGLALAYACSMYSEANHVLAPGGARVKSPLPD
jgi:hypothetical protein